MQKLTLHLPKYRLAVQYRLIKKRKSPLDEALIPTKKTLNLKYRVGSLTRKFFRHLFEHKKIKKIFGANIAALLIVSSFMPTNVIGKDQVKEETSIVNASETPIRTEIGTQYPVAKISITQGFNFFHPGLDLDGVTGDTIKPMKKGKVVSVEHLKFGYGNSIIVDHGNGLTSLYAHLSKINVQDGQEVTTDTKLGEMGASGHAFGDHLHFEVRDHGLTINPLSVLSR
jgi:murein DD-endopeptidase MepM/ murein hydrolase activator NlpD